MWTFAETAIVNCRLSFAEEGKQTYVFRSVCRKQTEVFCFRFTFTANKQKLLFSVSSAFRLRNSRNMETWTWRHGDMETWKHRDRHGDMKTSRMETWRHGEKETWRHGPRSMDMETTNGKWKWKPRRFSLTRLPFAYRANRSLSFACLLKKKQTELSVCKRTKRICSSMQVCCRKSIKLVDNY